MKALERRRLIDCLEEQIQGGVAESLENLIEVNGYDYDNLDPLTIREIESRFFTCDTCNWTMTVDEMSETEAGDWFLCRECAEDE